MKNRKNSHKVFKKASLRSKLSNVADESSAKILIKEKTGSDFYQVRRESAKNETPFISIHEPTDVNFKVASRKIISSGELERIEGEPDSNYEFYRDYLRKEESHLRAYAIRSRIDISSSDYLKNQKFLQDLPKLGRKRGKGGKRIIMVKEDKQKCTMKFLKERITIGILVLMLAVIIVGTIIAIKSNNILNIYNVSDDIIARIYLYLLVISLVVLIPASFILELGMNRVVLKIPGFLGILSFFLSFLISNDSQKSLQNFGAVLFFTYTSINCSLLLMDNLLIRSIGEFKSRVILAVDLVLVCILSLLYEDSNGFLRFFFLGVLGLNILGVTYEINSMMFKYNLKEFEEEVHQLYKKIENRNLTYTAFSPSSSSFRRFLERLTKSGKKIKKIFINFSPSILRFKLHADNLPHSYRRLLHLPYNQGWGRPREVLLEKISSI